MGLHVGLGDLGHGSGLYTIHGMVYPRMVHLWYHCTPLQLPAYTILVVES